LTTPSRLVSDGFLLDRLASEGRLEIEVPLRVSEGDDSEEEEVEFSVA
jgi:hypothetical protein